MVQALEEPKRSRQSAGRVPPHNLQAEESLLGAMLLSRDAIAAALEVCGPEDFYKPAHGHIFEAIQSLYGQGEPVDPVTVADELGRAGLLEAVGGVAALISLQADTPATANAGRYARIVEEHALLRRLIGVAGEIAELGYSVPDDVEAAVDRAEALVFGVAERRVTDTLKPLRELLEESLDRLARLFDRGESITGVPTGYIDLDERLSGLQPSSLVIVGARPSMGKALAVDTPVPTPSGWAAMGDLEAGDTVFDERGLPCRVTYVSPIRRGRPCYRVEFDDGSAIVADGDHRWLVYEVRRPLRLQYGRAVRRRRRARGRSQRRLRPGRLQARILVGPSVLTTAQLIERRARGRGGRAWLLPQAGPLELPAVELPVDPYAFGSLLGGGPAGPKRIPPAYLRASVQQRRALLEGMVSSCPDGAGGIRVFDEQLCGQVRELVCSLGQGAPRVAPRQVVLAGGQAVTAWDITLVTGSGSGGGSLGFPPEVAGPGGLAGVVEPAGSSRLWSQGSLCRLAGRAICRIVPVSSVPVRCIAVDSPSHLYLAGESMVPTHNTSFALGIAAHATMEARIPTLMFSLEMSHAELTQRLLVSEARVDASRIRNGRLAESDWPKISHAIGRLGEAPLYIDDNPNLTVMEIRAKARRLKARLGDLGLIIVDYLQLMSGRGSAENRQVEVSEISRGLKILARELNIPVVALSQLSRNLEMRSDKRPVLADLRESGSLEQDADVVLFLYRDEVYNPDSPDRGTAEVIVSKHRNGPTGTLQLAFLDHFTRFANMARV